LTAGVVCEVVGVSLWAKAPDAARSIPAQRMAIFFIGISSYLDDVETPGKRIGSNDLFVTVAVATHRFRTMT
jgi:hypothetical protein